MDPGPEETEAGDPKFKASLVYILRPCLNKTTVHTNVVKTATDGPAMSAHVRIADNTCRTPHRYMLRAVGLGRLRQEDYEFEASLGYIGKSPPFFKDLYILFI